MKTFPFEIITKDASGTRGRFGYLKTDHGTLFTPCFFPVGTAGTVKALTPEHLKSANAQSVLANSYHLYLKPGVEILKKAGGLHKFMAWDRPILTDSGGYQVFSLASLKKVRKDGVEFQSHHDGSYHFFTPSSVVQIQRAIGSDINMVLDLCAPYPCSHGQAREWHELTSQWAEMALEANHEQPFYYDHNQNLWAIMQGSVFRDLREASAEALVKLSFPGYAIGGLAVGEPKPIFQEVVSYSTDYLPEHKTRYLMGVGYPEDLLFAISCGVDIFDCVLPTRNGRNGMAFTWDGKLTIKAAREKENFYPLDEHCGCYTCRTFDRAYLRHLFAAEELLAMTLVSLHNIYFYQELMQKARDHLQAGDFKFWTESVLNNFQKNESTN